VLVIFPFDAASRLGVSKIAQGSIAYFASGAYAMLRATSPRRVSILSMVPIQNVIVNILPIHPFPDETNDNSNRDICGDPHHQQLRSWRVA
jgi:hypothetical protein